MSTFEQNINETIEKIVRNLNTMTNSIVDLYGKIEELNKSIEKIKELTTKEEKESEKDLDEDICFLCGGFGHVVCVDIGGEYIKTCPNCHGTGKNYEVKGD